MTCGESGAAEGQKGVLSAFCLDAAQRIAQADFGLIYGRAASHGN